MVAEVKLWGEAVGAVSWDASSQVADFEFEPGFIEKKINLAPITMPLDQLERGQRMYRFSNLPRETFRGLPGLLADTLPDNYGNKLINAWLAQQGRSSADFNSVERLCYMSKRGMGALEFTPALHGFKEKSIRIEIEELIDLAKRILDTKDKFNAKLGKNDEKVLNDIIRVGTSAGGARAKAVIAFNEKTLEMRSGQVEAPAGFSHWLLKFDGIKDEQLGEPAGYGRIEYAYYLMAKQAGINMAESRLLEENERAHFMTRRFDRESGNLKHQLQTLCGIAHFDYNDPNAWSYEQLFQVMRKMRLPYLDAVEMFRRIVFNVVARNLDDHTKNISFLLKKGSPWRLAPAYDVIYSYNPKGQWTRRHQMSINGKREDITRTDLLGLADQNNIKSAHKIIEEVLDTVSSWPEFAMQADVECKQMELIHANLHL